MLDRKLTDDFLNEMRERAEGTVEIKGGIKFRFHRNGDVTTIIEMANGHEIDVTIKGAEFDKILQKRWFWLQAQTNSKD